MRAEIVVEGRLFEVALEQDDDGAWTATVGDHTFPLSTDDGDPAVVRAGRHAFLIGRADDGRVDVDGMRLSMDLHALHGVAGADGGAGGALGPIHPPMTGKVDSILVEAGQTVSAGDVLFVLEAMKMRNEVKAGADGVVTAVHAAAGDAVEPKSVILELGEA